MNIQLSIIVPFYNVEQFIAQCLDRVFNQDVPETEYEVICVNDCSPDNSREIVMEYQKKHANLILIEHERNKKLGGARNTGVKSARGTYVLFLDSDDMMLENSIGRLLDEMRDGCEFIHFGSRTWDGVAYKEYTKRGDTPIMSGAELFTGRIVPWTEQIVAWNKIYRLDFLKAHNLLFVEDVMYEDNDYAFRVAAAAQKCRHIDYAPYLYRVNPYSVTGQTVNAQRLMYWQKIWPYMLALIPQLEPIDKRFKPIIKAYLQEDLYDMLRQMKHLSLQDRKEVKQSISIIEWFRIIRLLSIKRRVEYIYKLLRI